MPAAAWPWTSLVEGRSSGQMQNEASNAPREGRIRKRDGIDTSDGSHKLCAAHCLLGGKKSLRFHVLER